MGTAEKIDSKDRKIIAILRENAKSSLREIAGEVELSPSSVRNRIIRLENIGIIKRFTLDLDYRKLGYEIQVIVLITSKPGGSEELYDKLLEYNEISNVYWTAGPANFICIVRVRNMKELSELMTNELEKIDNIEKIETLFLMPRS